MTQLRKREYTLELVTPAFLGGADQQAEWRTPGIKALIRQWWRIAYVAEHGVNVNQMRAVEGKMFGTVSNNSGDATQADIRIRLGEWQRGSLQQMPRGGQTSHPEVKGGMNIGAFLYLGYGPLGYDKTSGVKLNKERAIDPKQHNTLTIIGKNLSTAEWELLESAMKYIALFGTIGGRSRNGWGSLSIKSGGKPLAALENVKNMHPKLLADCLKQDWPSAIGQGSDQRILVWKGTEVTSWEEAMNKLAAVKIAFRTDAPFKFHSGTHPRPENRHYLSYPVTNHAVSTWGNQKRLPNSLRFKVLKTANGRFLPIAFHLPHKLPDAFNQPISNSELATLWQAVHTKLDTVMTRMS